MELSQTLKSNLVGDDMNAIGKRIKHVPSTNDPLSADVYLIEGDKYCYIYDVGNNENSLHYINQLGKEKVVILSHFHKDHPKPSSMSVSIGMHDPDALILS